MRMRPLLPLALLALVACREETPALTAETVDFPWPFTVDGGSVECRDGFEIVFVSDGNAYPLNGAATNNAAERGYLPLQQIWADDPAVPGARVSITPMLNLGLAEC